MAAVLAVAGCGRSVTEDDLCGRWIEVVPEMTPYVQGIELNKDGTAESVGMATLRYSSWRLSGKQIILEGESIGNGQTIPFSDTMEVVSVGDGALTLAAAGKAETSYVRRQYGSGAALLAPVSGAGKLDVIFNADSSSVLLQFRDGDCTVLERRTRPDGSYVWNVEDDDTYLLEHSGLWSVSRRGRLLFTECVSGFPESPSREPYEGFTWDIVSGAGLRFWAQAGEHIKVVPDLSLPGAVIVKDSSSAPAVAMKVFSLCNSSVDDVIPQLKSMPGWDSGWECAFREVESGREGVSRYVLEPAGEYGEYIDSLKKVEPVPSTCNGWGTGNSGMRYFEVHDSHPDKALFVEIGQDAPLFDETCIVFTDDVPGSGEGVIDIMDGLVTIGHEVRSFVPEGSGDEFWLVDRTGVLEDNYDRLTGGVKNGKPVRASLKVEYAGRWDDGFAAEYDGVFLVREVLSVSLP